MAPGYRWYVDIGKLTSPFAIFGVKTHCQFSNTGELLKGQAQTQGRAEFPTSWVVTKNNSRHLLSKAGAIFLHTSFPVSAVSVSNTQKQGQCMESAHLFTS